MISALVGSSIILVLSILFITCWVNADCVWLDNFYLNGLDADSLDESIDNQTNFNDLSSLNSQSNTTTSLPFNEQSTTIQNINGFLNAINLTLGKCLFS